MTSIFKLAFLSTCVIAAISAALIVYLGLDAHPTDQTIKTLDTLRPILSGALGGITGLLGGKAT